MRVHRLLFAVVPFVASCRPGASTRPPVAAPSAPAAVAPPAAAPPRAHDAAATPYTGHGASSVSPETIARYAAPPLPPEVARHIQAMLDVRAPSGGVPAPDGKTLFFSWSVTGVSQVWRLDGPQRFPVQMTGGADATRVEDVLPDGRTIVVSRDRNGEENPGLYLQSRDGGPLTVVQHAPGVQTMYAFATDDGRAIFFRANDVKPNAFAIYRYDLATRARERVFAEDGLWDVVDHRPDGRMLLLKRLGNTAAEAYELDPATKKLTPLFGQGENEDYSAVYGAAEGEVLACAPRDGDFYRVWRWKGGTFTAVSPAIRHDVGDLAIDPARQRVFYVVNEDGYSRAHALDARTLRPITLPELPAADGVFFGDSSRDGRFTVVGIDRARAPLTTYLYDWKLRKLTQWQQPSAPEIDTARFAEPKLEAYPARDGTKIPMFVRRPDACAEPCPVIVSFHGGPEGQARSGFNARAQLFVDAGFVYVEPNVRGSSGYGKAWLHADDGPKRLQIITDIEDAAKYVRSAWAVNGKAPKVGITGGSYGGYSTLVGMTMFAGAYDAGAEIVGISDLVSFVRNTAPYRRALRATEYGDPDRDGEAMEKLSPMTYLDRVRAPLLLVQGVSDPRVPVGEALQIHDALAARHVEAPLILFADEGHGAQKRENRALEIGHVLAFFQKHLRGG